MQRGAARTAASVWTRALMDRAPADVPDPEMLSRCILDIAHAGDRGAFAVLFTHFAPRLKTFYIRGGMTGPEAEELAQETMLMIWRKAAQFDPAKASAAAWVYAIARNRRIDVLRRGPPRTTYTAPPGSPALPDPAAEQDTTPRADEAMASAQRLRGLRDALLALPEEQAAILRLSYLDGRSHAEVAQSLGLPLGTVKSRVCLALARLRRALEGST